jgi:hypothetical protein
LIEASQRKNTERASTPDVVDIIPAMVPCWVEEELDGSNGIPDMKKVHHILSVMVHRKKNATDSVTSEPVR